jgi:hypothetical protein
MRTPGEKRRPPNVVAGLPVDRAAATATRTRAERGRCVAPGVTREALPGLHALVLDDPRSAVTEPGAWIEREPLPMFYNWLSMAYSALGEIEAVKNVVREDYRTSPRYLFARLNYAERCLVDGDLDGAREALGPNLDIRALLGGRRRVHVSEVAGYFYAVSFTTCGLATWRPRSRRMSCCKRLLRASQPPKHWDADCARACATSSSGVGDGGRGPALGRVPPRPRQRSPVRVQNGRSSSSSISRAAWTTRSTGGWARSRAGSSSSSSQRMPYGAPPSV